MGLLFIYGKFLLNNFPSNYFVHQTVLLLSQVPQIRPLADIVHFKYSHTYLLVECILISDYPAKLYRHEVLKKC